MTKTRVVPRRSTASAAGFGADIEIASTLRSRLRGLLGKRATRRPLLITPCQDIHTFGMKKPIDVAFFDKRGCCIYAERKVGRRRRIRQPRAVSVMERFSKEGPWFSEGERYRCCFIKRD